MSDRHGTQPTPFRIVCTVPGELGTRLADDVSRQNIALAMSNQILGQVRGPTKGEVNLASFFDTLL